MMLCFVFSALIVVLDQFFKHWILRTIELGDTGPELIPGVLGLTRWENDGAMLNFLSGQQWLLALIALLASVILVAILLRYNEGFWGTLGLAAVLGGTVGNLVDRIFNDGKVIDMFRTLFINFPIFNIADIFITLGFITFLVHFVVLTFKTDGSEEPSSSAASRISKRAAREGYGDGGFDSYDDDDSVEMLDDVGIPAAPRVAVTPIVTPTAAAVATPVASPVAMASEEEYVSEAEYAPAEEYDYSAADAGDAHGDYDATTDTTPEFSFTMDGLESELGELDVEYDVDDILREYGIEND